MPPARRPSESQTVYSTATGRVRPQQAQATSPAVSRDGVVRVGRSTAGRGGKTVTIVTGLPPAAVADTAKELKRLCGTGGTAKDGIVEIQGDHRRRIVDHLASRYPTKLAGG